MTKKLPQTLLSWCYRIGGLLVVIGAAMPIFIPETYLTPYVFSLGALLFAAAQLLTPMPDVCSHNGAPQYHITTQAHR